MNPRWLAKAAALPVRQLHLAGAGLLLVAGAALWFHGLRAPLAQLRTVRAEHARLAQPGNDSQLLRAKLAALGADSDGLARKLGDAPRGPTVPLVVQLIGDISRLAVQHRVTLRGTAPAPEQKTVVFAQHGIDADATGRYADLLAWMAAIERSRPNLAIDSFQMRHGDSVADTMANSAGDGAGNSAATSGVSPAVTPPGDSAGTIHIKLRIAAYRPLGSTQ